MKILFDVKILSPFGCIENFPRGAFPINVWLDKWRERKLIVTFNQTLEDVEFLLRNWEFRQNYTETFFLNGRELKGNSPIESIQISKEFQISCRLGLAKPSL